MRIEGVEISRLTEEERKQLRRLLKARRRLAKYERELLDLQLDGLNGVDDLVDNKGESLITQFISEVLEPQREEVASLHSAFGSVRLRYANQRRRETITSGTTNAAPAEEPLDIEGIVAETVSEIVDEGRELVKGLVAIGRGVRGVTGRRRRRSRR